MAPADCPCQKGQPSGQTVPSLRKKSESNKKAASRPRMKDNHVFVQNKKSTFAFDAGKRQRHGAVLIIPLTSAGKESHWNWVGLNNILLPPKIISTCWCLRNFQLRDRLDFQPPNSDMCPTRDHSPIWLWSSSSPWMWSSTSRWEEKKTNYFQESSCSASVRPIHSFSTPSVISSTNALFSFPVIPWKNGDWRILMIIHIKIIIKISLLAGYNHVSSS